MSNKKNWKAFRLGCFSCCFDEVLCLNLWPLQKVVLQLQKMFILKLCDSGITSYSE